MSTIIEIIISPTGESRVETKGFAGSECREQATGYCVRLPDWRYPVVCDTECGRILYDNFEGRWGEPCELDRLMQAYACERAKLEARRNGHTVTEQPLADGSIKLTVHVGGNA